MRAYFRTVAAEVRRRIPWTADAPRLQAAPAAEDCGTARQPVSSQAAADAERRRPVVSASLPRRPPGRRAHASGFTITEFVIAAGLTVLGAGALLVFSESTGRTLVSLSNQSAYNQSAGNAVEFMIARIRLANTASVDIAGQTLTLGFDDDLTVDSDGDGFNWNDQDHFEVFQFVNADTNLATLQDNKIIYQANTAVPQSVDLVPTSTRQISGWPIFTLTNKTTVLINFGLLTTNATPFSQQMEIRNQGHDAEPNQVKVPAKGKTSL